MIDIRLAGVVITVVAALGFAIKMQQSTISGLRDDLSAAQGRIVGYEELSRFNARAKAADTAWLEIEKEVGESDAPLSSYMSGVAGRVWP